MLGQLIEDGDGGSRALQLAAGEIDRHQQILAAGQFGYVRDLNTAPIIVPGPRPTKANFATAAAVSKVLRPWHQALTR